MINSLIKIVKASVADPTITTDTPIAKSMDINQLFNNIVDILALLAGMIAFIYLVYSGILYLTAAGNTDAAKKGQQGLINAIIGIAVIVSAWTIINVVQGTLISTINSPTTHEVVK